MLLIKCPWCGQRDEEEFSYLGEAFIKRPKDPEQVSESEWADYLFMRKNPMGNHSEQWYHSSGCRQIFIVERNTLSYEILQTYKLDEFHTGEQV